MATTQQMIDRKEDTLGTQRKSNRLLPVGSTLCTQDPRPWQSTLRFQEISKETIAKSKRLTPGARTHRSAPPTPAVAMAATPSGSGKDRRYNSFGDVASIAAGKDTLRRCSHPFSRLPNSTSDLEMVNQPSTSAASCNNPALGKITAGKSISDASREIRVIKGAATGSRVGIRDPAAPGSTRANELCKDCKTSLRESVCFITNDGRISAAATGSAYTRNIHRCNVSGCAANRSSYPPLSYSISQKINPCSKPQSRLHPRPTRLKERNLSAGGEHSGHLTASSSALIGNRKHDEMPSCSIRGVHTPSIRGYKVPGATQELMQDTVETSSVIRGCDTPNMKQELNLMSPGGSVVQCGEGGGESQPQAESLCPPCTDQDALQDMVCSNCRKDGLHSASMQKDEPEYDGENDHTEVVDVCSPPAVSSTSCDTQGNDDDDKDTASTCGADEDDDKLGASAYADDIRALNDFTALLYHGHNDEYSCSDDGTNAAPTSSTMIEGAFDDLSNIDIEQTRCDNRAAGSQTSKWSSVARMRQRYLEALSEQEAEKVRLRKQEVLARKQSEDWMLDCHMGEVLHKLAPNGEVHVKVLVEAFETVAHHSDSESSQAAHHQDQDRQSHGSAP